MSVDHILTLVLGLAFAGLGGELFVRGAVGVAAALRIPPGIVGATIAAFATSSPELAVALGSALAGEPELALGDALGSNVVNVGLVLGTAVLVGPIRVGGGAISRDLAAAIAIPVLTVVLASDGRLGRPDALVLLARALVQDGRPERALEATDRVLRLVPGHPGALFVRGEAYAGTRRLAEASETWESLVRADPGSPWAAEARGRLRSVRDLLHILTGAGA